MWKGDKEVKGENVEMENGGSALPVHGENQINKINHKMTSSP